MLKKSLLALCVVLTCAGSHAATRYDFFFQSSNDTQSSGAYILWDGSQVVGGGGSLQDGGVSGLPGFSGTMSSFAGSSLDQFTFKLSGFSDVFALNFSSSTTYGVTNGASNVNYPVNARHFALVAPTSSASMQFGLIGYVSPSGTVYESSGYTVPQTALPVPEIDGTKLPQALALLGGLLLAYRSRKLFQRPRCNTALAA